MSIKAMMVFSVMMVNMPSLSQGSNQRFENKLWSSKDQIQISDMKGQDAIKLIDGKVWLENDVFFNGSISFDVMTQESLTFFGVMFRAEDDSNYEHIYLRAHLNNKPDTLQYTPVLNGNSAWQIYSGDGYVASANQTFENWNQVKIEVINQSAKVYVNSDAHVLHVSDLSGNKKPGSVGLWALSLDETPVYFSNIKIDHWPNEISQPISSEQKSDQNDMKSKHWFISDVIDESEVLRMTKLTDQFVNSFTWDVAHPENNGILNISRYRDLEKNTVLVKSLIKSKSNVIKEMRFGYSDKVRVFFNGVLLYSGNSTWRSRDYRFLGTVGLHDSVALPIQAGENHLIVAVTERFGGWAWVDDLQIN